MQKNILALVLAGGEGKRFWPIKINKSQIPFLGKTLLVHNLERLKLTGIKNVIVVIHSQDKERLTNLSVSGLSIQTLVQAEPNGMARAILTAAQLIKDRAILVMNATDLVSEKLYQELGETIGVDKMVVVGRAVEQYFPGGYFILQNDKPVGIVEKPGAGKEPSNLVNLIFDYFPQANELLTKLNSLKSNKDDLFELAKNELLKIKKVELVRYRDYWFALKYPWQALDIMQKLLENTKDYRGKNVTIKSNVTIEGPVYLGDDVRIFENSKIIGPCYIGNGTIIGNNNIIRHSQIGRGCVTGFNTDITRSYIGDNCWFHSNYIGDSVLEENISLGAGTVLANLRLDEGEISSVIKGEKVKTDRNKLGAIIGRNVRIGVNASIMPGIKIGSGSFVGAGVILGQDLPEQSFCLVQTTYKVTKNNLSIAQSREEFKKAI